MAVAHLTVLPRRKFPQGGEDPIEHVRRRPAWPASIAQDQAAVEQARKELGPDADPHDVLARAQQIKQEIKNKQENAHVHATN